jgi:hypothetical protein
MRGRSAAEAADGDPLVRPPELPVDFRADAAGAGRWADGVADGLRPVTLPGIVARRGLSSRAQPSRRIRCDSEHRGHPGRGLDNVVPLER